MDATRRVVREVKVHSEPEAVAAFLSGLGVEVALVGLEAGPLSQWLRDGLVRAGYETVLLETRHVKAALSATPVKTDRKDARGIAQLLRLGWFRPVHRKSPSAQELRALLAGRKLLQGKLLRGAVGPRHPARPVLKRWGLEVAKRRGLRRAKVAVARKLSAVLHRIWRDGGGFRWGKEPAIAAA
jgi:hypothetical protein